jgi:DNA polymerase alpha subunit A
MRTYTIYYQAGAIAQHAPASTVPATSTSSLSPAERAHHPEAVLRSNGVLVPDVQWYLTQQLVPPIARLCEPIEGTSAATIAQHMGLDASKFNKGINNAGNDIRRITMIPCNKLRKNMM